jgi:16S rRNA processing protein RimM
MPDGTKRELKVEDQWFHKNRVILKFEGFDTMTAARDLVGGCLIIGENDLSPLADGEFFEHQLIGSVAVDEQSKNLGQVTGLLRTGGTDVLVVRHKDGRELLIPFADDICIDVDVTAKRITVKPPDGLLDL